MRRPVVHSGFQSVIAILVAALILLPTKAGALISIKEEKEIGQKVLKQVQEQLPIIDDPYIANYIQRVGQEALRQVDSTHFDFDFWVIDNPVVNAFAIPGGHIFLFRGIIELMDSKDELMGVVFHEVGHVQARHFAERVDKAKKVSIATLAGALAAVLVGGGEVGSALMTGALATGQTIMLKYSRTDEEEADRLGLSWMERGKYDSRAMAEVFSKMIKSRWLDTNAYPAYLSSHPGLDERVVYLQNAIQSHKLALRERAKDQDQLDFEEFKVRLIALYENPLAAMSKLRQLSEAKPTDSMPYYGMGLLLLRSGRRAEALEALKKAIELNPYNARTFQILGKTYFLMGDMPNAKAALSQAIIYDPSQAEARFYLGRVYSEEGAWKLALANYEKARSVDDSIEELYYHMAKAESKVGSMAEAHYLYGIHSEKSGDTRNAKFHFEKALQEYRGNPEKEAEIEKRLKDLEKKPEEEKKNANPEGDTPSQRLRVFSSHP